MLLKFHDVVNTLDRGSSGALQGLEIVESELQGAETVLMANRENLARKLLVGSRRTEL